MSGEIIAFTDGACKGNNLPANKRRAGCGVYFPHDSSENISVPLPETKGFNLSNNRAEIYAVILAINQIMMLYSPCSILIKTDSQLTINSAVEWLPKWRIKYPKKLANIDLIKLLDSVLTRAKENGYTPIQFEYVAAHKKAPIDNTSDAYFNWFGNAQADILANKGANKY